MGMVYESNLETGEHIVREMTTEELAIHEARQADAIAADLARHGRLEAQATARSDLAAHAAANPDDPVATLARALGLV